MCRQPHIVRAYVSITTWGLPGGQSEAPETISQPTEGGGRNANSKSNDDSKAQTKKRTTRRHYAFAKETETHQLVRSLTTICRVATNMRKLQQQQQQQLSPHKMTIRCFSITTPHGTSTSSQDTERIATECRLAVCSIAQAARCQFTRPLAFCITVFLLV